MTSTHSRDGQTALPEWLPVAHCGLDLVAGFFVDVFPLFEGAFQHVFGDAVAQVPGDVGDQARTLDVVHHVAHQGAGLFRDIGFTRSLE
jgi:hypothetical protein